MDDLEIEYFCPLNQDNRCRSVKDGKVYQCRWFEKVSGKDAEGNDVDEWNCCHVFANRFRTQMYTSNVNVAASINSLRNETVRRQDFALEQLKGVKREALKSK